MCGARRWGEQSAHRLNWEGRKPIYRVILAPRTFDFKMQIKKGGAHPKLSLKRKEAIFLEQGYALTDLCSQGSTYDENVLVDVDKPLKQQSWYIALTRGKDPNKIALVSPLTLGTLLKFAGIGAATSARSGATDDGDLGGVCGSGGGGEQKDGGSEESDTQDLEFAGDGKSTRRDVLSEVARLKRLAEITRSTYPARSSADSLIDGLRGVDKEWYDEATRGRPGVEPAPDKGIHVDCDERDVEDGDRGGSSMDVVETADDGGDADGDDADGSSSSSDPRSLEQLRRDAWTNASRAIRIKYEAIANDHTNTATAVPAPRCLDSYTNPDRDPGNRDGSRRSSTRLLRPLALVL